MVMNYQGIQQRFRSLSAFLDERMRRLVAAAESDAIGYGGVSAVARATGVSRRAITEGLKELRQAKASREARPAQSRIRRKGAGRKFRGAGRTHRRLYDRQSRKMYQPGAGR